MRNRKNMRPAPPMACMAARRVKLAASLEKRVGDETEILPIIEQNTLQIFVKIEKMEFT